MNISKFLLFGLLTCSLSAQTSLQMDRTIEVSGKAISIIDPEGVLYNITIEEYWVEEFEGKKYEEYKTKVEIEKIETDLVEELNQLGIGLDKITLKRAGNYWRPRGKDFLVSKNLELHLESLEQANQVSNELATRGIKGMSVSKLLHEDLEEHELKTQIMALNQARKKAEVLAQSLGETLGKVKTVVEIDRNAYVFRDQAMTRTMASAESANAVQYENFSKLRIEKQVRVVFYLD